MKKIEEDKNVKHSDPEEADVVEFLFKLCAFAVVIYVLISLVGFDTPIITF